VNFWQPGGKRRFQALNEGELFLFKLHSPNDFIVGGGLFAHSSLLPVSLAWDAFGESNGVSSMTEMRARIERYRSAPADPLDDYTIGCIILTQPFYFDRSRWIPIPSDWDRHTVQGKRYDLTQGNGRTLFDSVQDAVRSLPDSVVSDQLKKYGDPVLVKPRLGQGAFRLVVTDAYDRRCSLSGEKVLPVLEAAHIRPYSRGGEHHVNNGILLRSDLHVLFDRGYITVARSNNLEVSRRLREEFENGRDYYALHGRTLRAPLQAVNRPLIENLTWHNDNVYRG